MIDVYWVLLFLLESLIMMLHTCGFHLKPHYIRRHMIFSNVLADIGLNVSYLCVLS